MDNHELRESRAALILMAVAVLAELGSTRLAAADYHPDLALAAKLTP